VIQGHLAKAYDVIERLEGASSEQIGSLLRSKTGSVDLFVLGATHLDAAALEGARGLRLVYLNGAGTDALVQPLRAAGAQAVAARKGAAGGFYEIHFARFVRDWGAGKTVQEALADAEKQVSLVSRNAYRYLSPRQSGQTVFSGQNIDLHGVPSQRLTLSMAESGPVVSQSTFAHEGFSDFAIRASGAMLTGAEIESGNVPNIDVLFNGVKNSAWDYMGDAFQAAEDDLPSVNPEEANPSEYWVDGEAVKYLLGGLAQWGGDLTSGLLDKIDGVRLTRGSDDLSVAVYFSREFTAQWKAGDASKSFALTGARLPKTLRFRLSMKDGVATITGLDDGVDGHDDVLALLVKIPLLTSKVYLRWVQADLTSGNISVEAGVLGDSITLDASALIRTKSFKVDIWKSIESNLDVLDWPSLIFSRN
jgi:hypothetical protein